MCSMFLSHHYKVCKVQSSSLLVRSWLENFLFFFVDFAKFRVLIFRGIVVSFYIFAFDFLGYMLFLSNGFCVISL
jgi:hypothetical protein